MVEAKLLNISKPKRRLTVLLWLEFLLPVFLFVNYMSTSKFCSFVQAYALLFSFPLIFCTILYLASAFILTRNIKKKIFVFSGLQASEENLDQINTAINKEIILMVLIPFLNSIIMPLLYSIGFRKAGYTGFHTISFYMVCIGYFFLVGTFVYIIWYGAFCDWTSHVYMDTHHVAVSITVKNTLIAVITTIGLICMACAPIFSDKNQVMSPMQFFYSKMLSQLITGLVYLTIDFLLMTKHLAKNLNMINSYTSTLGKGDYSKDELECLSRDELGLLSNSVNIFKDSTRKLLNNIKSTVNTTNVAVADTNSSMDNIEEICGKLTENFKLVQTNTDTQVAAVMNAYMTTEDILKDINSLSNNIQSQSSAVEQSAAAVKQMVSNIQSVTNILSKNSEQVELLSSAANIGQNKVQIAVNMADKILNESAGLMEASSVITNIAEQTNLLAMNAAIEAAHAGESGKGFAVVADEIRKLAEQSNEQGKKITESLAALETVINEVGDSTKELQNQFNEIYKFTQIVKQQEDVVMSAMTEQNEGSTQILDAISSMNDITSKVRVSSNQMEDKSNTVMNQMKSLESATNSIRTTIIEVVGSGNSIKEALLEGTGANGRTIKSIKELNDGMNHFKLEV